MLLDVKNLAVSYAKNSKPTIEGVSFELDEGEILAVVGESGSGKTTVIRAILNVLPGGGKISNGTIIFNGRNLGELDNSSWRSLRGKFDDFSGQRRDDESRAHNRHSSNTFKRTATLTRNPLTTWRLRNWSL